jgi:hypothetical protein
MRCARGARLKFGGLLKLWGSSAPAYSGVTARVKSGDPYPE